VADTSTSDPVRSKLLYRARKILKILDPFLQHQRHLKEDMEFYVAGGCMAGNTFYDVDLFPRTPIKWELKLKPEWKVLSDTPNALTVDVDGTVVQFCSYSHPTLEALVESFDYAHIQVGARVLLKQQEHLNTWHVKELYTSEAYHAAWATQSTWFTGSEYPLSSLIRAEKYYRYGIFSKGTYIKSVIQTLTEVVRRGFKNYADFKDQLDAVDLGLLPENLKEVDFPELRNLYDLLTRDPEDKEC
jgi:hypothetical protein